MTWTAARPTKPGKYWLSIGIDHREKFASDVCREPHHVYLLDIFEEGGGLWLDGVVEVGHCLPASALFNRYVEPADPHAQPVPQQLARLTLSITTEERQTLSGSLHAMAGSLRKCAETNPSEAHRAIAEANKMDALNARICEGM